ncbi:MAG: Cytochrome c biogenesis ATP-binding export protein CcmA [Alphaproteobacteria bacterium MarineAlpha5_Bin8]|mgnify:CR=1 FL=1|nr:MAG: Cytochrome c biogenesis ATP-binding export protein CcmA [Alphaproteobacteria bacterium MarineAlpha5_Bin7]PPR46363.1 MAG: Cytochrome c biogenesis ATP-binding export protein CcmA [Alphaproteobacteria bacterium MarineAlpha5_Bin8]PPR54912.1 MAG: Cytochrome c biogenesis ATP-binding export protein CcmA [Alphaproteobacteria bacterium MarineAlpha5_Bin6]|tara:strand:+ start:177 stop:800 length:624 start_codon:yes stop_codon:yes gene_type:complete
MLLANNLSFRRENQTIFNSLDLSLSPKKIIHLYGNNGVGKTTLIKILADVLNSDSGEIYWNGKNIKKNTYEYFSNLTYIMDSNTSNNQMSVIENINYWTKLFSSNIKSTELESVLKMLFLNTKKDIKAENLSRGEIKKLELIRLVIEKKKFWLLDEPYSGLDNDSIVLINETFRNHLNSNGMIIFASHYCPEIPNIETIDLAKYANN